MNRHRCCSGRRPESPAARGTPIPGSPWLRLVATLLLVLAAAAGGSARAQTDEPALSCPVERELCVQAERSGGIDLKTGVAHLEGNVQGLVRSRALRFSGQSLTAYRDSGQEWVRLVLDQDVRLRQTDRKSASDHGVLEREEIRLTGNVSIEQQDLRIDGAEAEIRSDGSRTVVRGLPEAPLTLVLQRPLLTDASAPGSAAAGGTTSLRAQKMVLENQPRRAVLTGNVHLEQSNDHLRLDAEQVTLNFSEGNVVESFRAEGNVVIAQPERRISADFAQSRNELRTILLVGHATMQQKGAFDLKSDRMEVYADASKGILQSHDRQKPITLSLDLAGGSTYGLTQAGILKLSAKGVSPTVLEKLAPLIDKTFPSRATFREAVSQRLTRHEQDTLLDTILANAR